MARRKLTLRRIDPWTVLKFGSVLNVCMLAIGLLGFGVLWFAIRQLGVIEQFCELATDVGFQECGINGGNLFRYLLLLGILGVVIQTGLMVFLAFLHNLIADLVGGLSFTLQDEGGPAAGRVRTGAASGRPAEQRTSPGGRPTVGAPTAGPVRTGAATAGATAAPTTGDGTPKPARADTRTSPQTQRTPRDRPGSTARTGSGDEGIGRWPWERARDASRERARKASREGSGGASREGSGGAGREGGAGRGGGAGVKRSGAGPASGEGSGGASREGSGGARGGGGAGGRPASGEGPRESERSDESLFGGRGSGDT